MDEEKEITNAELNRGYKSEELWDEWPDVVVNQTELLSLTNNIESPALRTSER